MWVIKVEELLHLSLCSCLPWELWLRLLSTLLFWIRSKTIWRSTFNMVLFLRLFLWLESPIHVSSSNQAMNTTLEASSERTSRSWWQLLSRHLNLHNLLMGSRQLSWQEGTLSYFLFIWCYGLIVLASPVIGMTNLTMRHFRSHQCSAESPMQSSCSLASSMASTTNAKTIVVLK